MRYGGLCCIFSITIIHFFIFLVLLFFFFFPFVLSFFVFSGGGGQVSLAANCAAANVEKLLLLISDLIHPSVVWAKSQILGLESYLEPCLHPKRLHLQPSIPWQMLLSLHGVPCSKDSIIARNILLCCTTEQYMSTAEGDYSANETFGHLNMNRGIQHRQYPASLALSRWSHKYTL